MNHESEVSWEPYYGIRLSMPAGTAIRFTLVHCPPEAWGAWGVPQGVTAVPADPPPSHSTTGGAARCGRHFSWKIRHEGICEQIM